jgi:predicted phosphodiesterase
VASKTVTDRIAIISDVHGNMTALEATLRHIRDEGIERIFNLGDLVGKGPRSAEAVDRCREVCEVTVQGNWDWAVAVDPEADHPAALWHRAQLGAERGAYLASLPAAHNFLMSGLQVRLFHASQIGIFHRVRDTDPREVHRAMFENTDFTGDGAIPQIVGYGDIHRPYALTFEGRTLFNAGSVGNPLDVPLACYAVLDGIEASAVLAPWSIRIVRLPYDIESEITAATRLDMPDLDHYANELRTAKYRGLTPRTPAS